MAREVSFTNPAKQFPTFYYCCDRKARAACGQSFKLWQQATIDSTCHDNSIDCFFTPHIYGCCSSRTSRSWWTAHSTKRQRRGCNFNKGVFYASTWHMTLAPNFFATTDSSIVVV